MKKILFASAAMLITAGTFTVAQADEVTPGVKLSGDARTRLVYRDNFDFGNSNKDAHSYLDSRIRLKVEAQAAGGAYAKGRIRLIDGKVENNDSDGPSTKVDGDANVWADYAYIGIPFSDAFTIEAGKYRETYGTGFFYNDIPMGGIRGIIKAGNVEINPFVNWMSEGQSSKIALDKAEDNDNMLFGVHVGAQINEDWNAGALVGYMTDDRTRSLFDDVTGFAETFNQHEGLIAAGYFSGKSGNFGLSGEIAYNDASVRGFNQWVEDAHDLGEDGYGSDQADDGFGFYLQPSFTMDALTLAINAGMTQGNFGAAPGFGFVMIGTDHPLTVVNVGDLGEWMWAGLVASYAISDSLTVTGNVAYASIDGDSNMGLGSISDALEISAQLEYAISKGATFTWYAGTLMPSFDDPAVEDDPAIGTYGRFNIKF